MSPLAPDLTFTWRAFVPTVRDRRRETRGRRRLHARGAVARRALHVRRHDRGVRSAPHGSGGAGHLQPQSDRAHRADVQRLTEEIYLERGAFDGRPHAARATTTSSIGRSRRASPACARPPSCTTLPDRHRVAQDRPVRRAGERALRAPTDLRTSADIRRRWSRPIGCGRAAHAPHRRACAASGCDNPFYERAELALSDDSRARLDWQFRQLRVQTPRPPAPRGQDRLGGDRRDRARDRAGTAPFRAWPSRNLTEAAAAMRAVAPSELPGCSQPPGRDMALGLCTSWSIPVAVTPPV